MEWLAPIDLYCERTAVGFWNEPLNALSNASFLVAAWWAYQSASSQRVLTIGLWGALLLAGSIGIGSFLFHTFASSWSELSDVVPIWSFIAWYIVLAVHNIGGLRGFRLWRVGTIVVASLLVSLIASDALTVSSSGAEPPATLFNGSLQYLPALLALYVFAGITMQRRLACRCWIMSAACLFTLSLIFRTLDRSLCDVWSLGTHFGWHLFNGAMVACLLQGLISQRVAMRSTVEESGS